MQKIEALQVNKYLTQMEIESHLLGVEYIIMAAPSVRENPKYPIHFTIFLNTKDILTQDIKDAILDKFCEQYKITSIVDQLSELSAVAFALTSNETPMPLHLFKEDDRKVLQHTYMHVIDFEGNSSEFKEPKDGLTGWSYSYN